MAITLALLSTDIVGNRIVKRYSVTASGSYANAGSTGDLLDFQGATNTNRYLRAKFSRVPDGWRVCNQPGGYVMRLEPGTTFSTFGVRFWEAGADGGDLDEIANGAYPSGITDTDGNALQIELSGKNI